MSYNFHTLAASCLCQESTDKATQTFLSIHYLSLYQYFPDEGSLLPKYRDCTIPNGFAPYFMCCDASLTIYIYIFHFINAHG